MPRRWPAPSVGVDTTASSRAGPTGPCRARQKSACSSGSVGAGTGGFTQDLRLGGTGTLRLGEDILDGGEAIVPLDQGGQGTETADRLPVEIPHPGAHGGVMGVEQMGAVVTVPGQMYLPDAVSGQSGKVVLGPEPVVRGAHEDVVHVEQYPAVGPL